MGGGKRAHGRPGSNLGAALKSARDKKHGKHLVAGEKERGTDHLHVSEIHKTEAHTVDLAISSTEPDHIADFLATVQMANKEFNVEHPGRRCVSVSQFIYFSQTQIIKFDLLLIYSTFRTVFKYVFDHHHPLENSASRDKNHRHDDKYRLCRGDSPNELSTTRHCNPTSSRVERKHDQRATWSRRKRRFSRLAQNPCRERRGEGRRLYAVWEEYRILASTVARNWTLRFGGAACGCSAAAVV